VCLCSRVSCFAHTSPKHYATYEVWLIFRVFLIDLPFGNWKFNIQRIFKMYKGKMSIRLLIYLHIEGWLLRSQGFFWHPYCHDLFMTYVICHPHSMTNICHIANDIHDICPYGCLKKPQDLSNQASNYKSIYNLILNSKFVKNWNFPFINFENPLYIKYSISKW
jgi:hypothetical protein